MTTETVEKSERISDADKLLVEQLKEKVRAELDLVGPEYEDDYSMMRWLVGWDRKIDQIVPRLRNSLRSIHALGLHKMNFDTIDEVTEYCDSLSEPLTYLPGALLGFDANMNALSLQLIGRIDAASVIRGMRNSDLYRMRIAESEGVMQIIRREERRLGRQLGTSAIFDLDGLSMGQIDVNAMKVINLMLTQLQEMFPDVIRKIFVIRAPSFVQMFWSMVSPCLAKQTQQKITFLGADWKEKLKESIGEDVLFPHWGGVREGGDGGEFGFVKLGGKMPDELRYDPSNDKPADELSTLKISARNTAFVPITVTGEVNEARRLRWWWRLDGHDISFSVARSTCKEGDASCEHSEDELMQPKFRLQTDYVPEDGEINAAEPGVYKLQFDNKHSTLRGKTVRYWYEVVEE